MTKARLLREMPALELAEWMAEERIRAEEDKQARKHGALPRHQRTW